MPTGSWQYRTAELHRAWSFSKENWKGQPNTRCSKTSHFKPETQSAHYSYRWKNHSEVLTQLHSCSCITYWQIARQIPRFYVNIINQKRRKHIQGNAEGIVHGAAISNDWTWSHCSWFSFTLRSKRVHSNISLDIGHYDCWRIHWRSLD